MQKQKLTIKGQIINALREERFKKFLDAARDACNHSLIYMVCMASDDDLEVATQKGMYRTGITEDRYGDFLIGFVMELKDILEKKGVI